MHHDIKDPPPNPVTIVREIIDSTASRMTAEGPESKRDKISEPLVRGSVRHIDELHSMDIRDDND